MGRNFSEDNRLGAATDTPASRERGPIGQQLAEGARPEDKLAKAQTFDGGQVLPTSWSTKSSRRGGSPVGGVRSYKHRARAAQP